MDYMVIKMKLMMSKAKLSFIDFIEKEKGGSEIIALVLVIAIVLVLAGVFWDRISVFFGELMTDMLGKNPLDKINSNNIPVATPTP